VIDRRKPGRGFRHVLKPKDIRAFIEILPDWDQLSVGLDAIVLAAGSREVYGYHTRGVVHICAWEKDLWLTFPLGSFEGQRVVIERLGVPYEREKDGVVCKFDEEKAKAHQLLATMLHELGHHHDRMTTNQKTYPGRGEAYAETYARRYAERIWVRYQEVFGIL
jgi:hypothetical protein